MCACAKNITTQNDLMVHIIISVEVEEIEIDIEEMGTACGKWNEIHSCFHFGHDMQHFLG